MKVGRPSPRSGGARAADKSSAAAEVQITIVTATLNAFEELKQTICSVREQVGCLAEHIVIDGGSMDETVAYLQQHGDTVALWQSEPDRGIADAMNKAIALARGEYVLVLHAGDTLIDRNALAQAARLLMGEDILAFDVV